MARKRTRPQYELIGFQPEDLAHIPLSRARITQAGLKLLNESGLKELSMRKVAEELDVQPASLYYHVKGKEQLLQLLADHISSEMERPDPSLPWRTQLEQWGDRFRRILSGYRDAAELFQATIALSYNRLLQMEQLFQMFAAAGFPDSQIPWMASLLKNYVLSYAAEEAQLLTHANQGDTTLEELGRQHNQLYDQLPPDMFPNVIRLAPHMTNTDWQQEFHFGLGVLLDGFDAKRPQAQRPSQGGSSDE